MAASPLFIRGSVTESGGLIVARNEPWKVTGAATEVAALSDPELPAVGSSDGNGLIAFTRTAQRLGSTDDVWRVDIGYTRFLANPAFSPPPDRDDPDYYEERITASIGTVDVPVVYSIQVFTPQATPPDFVGPLQDVESFEWRKDVRKTQRPELLYTVQVNLPSFSASQALAIQNQIGRIHNLPAGDGWVFLGADAQRSVGDGNAQSGRTRVTYRWKTTAVLPAIDAIDNGNGTQVQAIPMLGANEVYIVVEVPVNDPLPNGTRPEVMAINPYDTTQTGSWQSLPGVVP